MSTMKPRSKFARWMLDNMWELDMNQKDVADKLHTTKQTISNHYVGRFKPSYPFVVAYCLVFGNKDDPEEIWKMVEEET